MEKSARKNKRVLKGVVVSDKMTNTLVVETLRMKKHPKYDKRYRVSKRYHVHDTSQSFKVGDQISFQECRPLSKTKRWFALPKKNKPITN